MAQNVVDFSDNPSGAGLMDNYLAKDQQNVLTSNSGIQRPSYAVAGTKWLDTSVTPWLWKMYDGTNDVTLGSVNPSTHLFTPAGILPSQDGQSGKFLQTNGSNTVWTDAVNYTNITNCITAIPQDIKLELNDGTLTLKAGSKVYDGAGNIINVNSDCSNQHWGLNEQVAVFFNKGSEILPVMSLDRCFSGSTAPSSPENNSYWYDTSNKVIKQYSTSTSSWSNTSLTLPIAIVTMTGNGTNIESIDQVFNGFGYIGSTIFALPGTEVLVPNGWINNKRNNNKYIISNVIMVNNTFNNLKNYIRLGENLQLGPLIYDIATNYNYNSSISSSNKRNYSIVGTYRSDSTSRIISMSVKLQFMATDYNDYIVEIGKCAKLDENNAFSGNNTFTRNNIFTGNNTFSGNNAFSGNNTIITPEISSNDTTIVNTSWVNSYFNTSGRITDKCVPIYTAGVTKTPGIEYTAEVDCIAIGYDERSSTGAGTCKFLINNVNVRISSYQDNYSINSFTYFIPKGSTYKVEISGVGCQYIVYPLKGA